MLNILIAFLPLLTKMPFQLFIQRFVKDFYSEKKEVDNIATGHQQTVKVFPKIVKIIFGYHDRLL